MRFVGIVLIAIALAGCGATRDVVSTVPTAVYVVPTLGPPPPTATPISVSTMEAFSARIPAALRSGLCPGLTAWNVLATSPNAAPGTCTVLEGTLTPWSQTPGNYLIATPAPGGPAIAMLQWGGLPLATGSTVYTVFGVYQGYLPGYGSTEHPDITVLAIAAAP